MPAKLTHIELADDGFRLIEEGLEQSNIDWLHLKQIVAYRRDPDGRDLMCLGFRKSLEKQYIEVNEEMDGYRELLEAVYDKFPSVDRHWWQKVAGEMGVNYQTIYGIGLAEQTAAPKAAAKYLNSIEKRKKRHTFRQKTLIIALAVAVLAILIYLISR